MTHFAARRPVAACLTLLLAVALASLSACDGGGAKGSPGGLVGWEKGSAFDQKYNVAEFDKIKGYFVKISDVTPLPGMAEGSAVVLKDRADGEPVTVIVGPSSFVHEDLEKLGLRDGERINAYGAWTRLGDKDVLIATKIKKNEKEFLKVRRTKDGMPYWSMSKEDLAKEREAMADE